MQSPLFRFSWLVAFGLAGALAGAGCRDTSSAVHDDASVAVVDAALAPADATPGPPDADLLAPDASDQPDGPPVRRACSNSFGQGLDTLHGRLDGTLVSIVQPGAHGCNGDADHVHLQVEMNGATYDVAINVADTPAPVQFLTRDLPLPDGAWAEGWHTGASGSLDYPSLGLHAADFTATSQSALVAQLNSELATANHVSVFMTGYGPDGGHNVHRRGTFVDGAIVVRPLSALPHLLFFHFANQNF